MHLDQWRPSVAALVVCALLAGISPPFTTSAHAQVADSSDLTRKEVEDRRTKYSKTFDEGNGTYTAEISTRPLHYRHEDGSWQDLDTTLVPCTSSNCAWRNSAGSFSAEFAAAADSAALVRIEEGGRRISFGLSGASATSVPIVDGNRITYAGIMPGVDLTYEVTATSVKELIVLNERPSGPVEFEFPLMLTELTATQTPSGDIELTRTDGKVESLIPGLWMEDSAKDPHTGEGAWTESVESRLSTASGSPVVTVIPDQVWLEDPSRVYPVVIDPIFNMDTNRDTWIRNGTGSHENDNTLRIGSDANAGPPARTLVYFPIDGVLPDQAVVRNSRLGMWNTDSHGTSCSGTRVDVHRITSGWSENVSWDGQPSFDSTVLASTTSHRQPDNANCDPWTRVDFGESGPMPNGCGDPLAAPWVPTAITSVVRDWHINPVTNKGLLLKVGPEGLADTWKFYGSSEALKWPVLIVSYTNPPYAPTNLSPASGTTSDSTTPALRATYSDPDGAEPDAGCARFTIWPSGQPSQTQVAFGEYVSSGSTSVCPPPGQSQCFPNKLAQGTTYEWKVSNFDEWTDGPDNTGGRFTYHVAPPPPPQAPSVSGPTPSSPSNYLSPRWSFTGSQSGGWFQCRLMYEGVEKQGWNACTSPKEYYLGGTGYWDGSYNIQVRQIDDFGATGAVGYGNGYVLDRVAPPEPTITASPSSPGNNTSPQWSFSSGGGDTTSFNCRLTRADGTVVHNWGSCSTPSKSFSATEHDVTYHFEVRSLDAASNQSNVVRSGGYRLDIQVSAPTITDAPATPGTNANPSWTFSGESGAVFECSLTKDGTELFARESCTSPHSYSLAASGRYIFHVRQTDLAANTSDEATHSYTYDVSAPEAPVVSATPHSEETGWYSSRTPGFTWTVPSPPPSGISGYSYLLNGNQDTTPPDAVTGTAASKDYTNPPLDEGIWWFHVKAKSGSGVWGTAVGHRRIQIDDTAPSAPDPISKTHVPGVAFKNNRIEVTWLPSTDLNPGVEDVSGVKEYWWAFRLEGTDGDRGPAADGACSPTDLCTSSADNPSARSVSLADGRYWFHVRSRDNAGNLSADVAYGPLIVAQDGASVPLAPTLSDALAAHSDTNGLEQFYPYRSMSLGTAEAFVNLHSGNLVVQQSDAVIPLVGLNSVIRHTYNSQRDVANYHDTGVGKGWVLSLSDSDPGLDGASGFTGIDLNTPLLSAGADVVAGAAGRILELTDGDGSAHRFVKDGLQGSRWESPPGVNLRLQETLDATTNLPIQYDLIRPDGVRYIVKQVTFTGVPVEWRVVAVRDRNGNELTLNYDTTTVYSTGGTQLFSTRVASISHSRHPTEPVALFKYGANGNLDWIESLPNTHRRVIDFVIDQETRQLRSVTKNSQSILTRDKQTTTYTYTEHDPDGNELTINNVDLLTAVTDARTQSTRFSYKRADGVYRLSSMTDRRGKLWDYDYRTDATSGDRIATLTSPMGHSTAYRSSQRTRISDSDRRIVGGNIREIQDAGNNSGRVVKTYDWLENHLVSKRDAASDATTTMEYNDLGLLESVTMPPPNDPAATNLHSDAPKVAVKTTFDYAFTVDYPSQGGCDPNAAPVEGPIYHREGRCFAVADLTREVVADNLDDQQSVTEFAYSADGAGDLTHIYERASKSGDVDRVTQMSYYASGLLRSIDGPRTNVNDVTEFGDRSSDPYGGYHRSGSPLQIRDGQGNLKTFTYNAYGAVTKITDREGRVQTMVYDERDNLLQRTDLWASLTSNVDDRVTAFTYDGNDNRDTATSPKGTATGAILDDHTTEFHYNENDQRSEVRRPGLLDPTQPRITTFAYDDDGLRTSIDGPLSGTSDRTSLTYWPNGALRVETAPAATGNPAVTRYFYDLGGRISRMELPKVASTGAAPEQNLTYTPHGAPAVIRETSAAVGVDRVTSASYDAHGRLIEVLGPRKVDGIDQAQRQTYDSFGQLRKLSTRLSEPSWLEHVYVYDLAGNVIKVSQPAGSGPADALTSEYTYDALNRLSTQTVDPFNPGHTVEYSYWAEGQQKLRKDLVDGTVQRSVSHAYNPDDSVQQVIATDHSKPGSPTLAQCNFHRGSPATSGYDRDGNLLVNRTLRGQCSDANEIGTQTFEYNHAGFLSSATQTVNPLDACCDFRSRVQRFEYREDGSVVAHTWNGHRASYDHSPAGWMTSATHAGGGLPSTFTYHPSGTPDRVKLGDSTMTTGVYDYHPDGAVKSLVWTHDGATEVRAHRNLEYDAAGFLHREDVSIVPATGDLNPDTGGQARFGYDLAGRLTSWKSPFRLNPDRPATDEATTRYSLDDSGNVTHDLTSVDGVPRREVEATYSHGRLTDRVIKTFGLVSSDQDTVSNQTFQYNRLGEEERRETVTRIVDDLLNQDVRETSTTTYDERGLTKTLTRETTDLTGTSTEPVEYLYDGFGRVIARKRGSDNWRYYFYWGTTSNLAEETNHAGQTMVRYFNSSSGDPIAELKKYRRDDATVFDPADNTETLGAWVWLLRDAHGSVATEIRSTGTVIGQRAFDPYGAADKGGSSSSLAEPRSTLGFQGAHTDRTTGRILLGQRQYDPSIQRFTTPDVFVGSGADLELGTDPLSSNRYVFAASNPVSFYDDGHRVPCEGDCSPTARRRLGNRAGHNYGGQGGSDLAVVMSPPPATAMTNEKSLLFDLVSLPVDLWRTFAGSPQDNLIINSVPDMCHEGSGEINSERIIEGFSLSTTDAVAWSYRLGIGTIGITARAAAAKEGAFAPLSRPAMEKGGLRSLAKGTGTAFLVATGVATGIDVGCDVAHGIGYLSRR